MLKDQIAVLMQLQIALHDPSRGIRVLSGKNNGHFQKNKNVLSHRKGHTEELPTQCLQRERAKKVKHPLHKKGKTTMSDDFEVGGEN